MRRTAAYAAFFMPEIKTVPTSAVLCYNVIVIIRSRPLHPDRAPMRGEGEHDKIFSAPMGELHHTAVHRRHRRAGCTVMADTRDAAAVCRDAACGVRRHRGQSAVQGHHLVPRRRFRLAAVRLPRTAAHAGRCADHLSVLADSGERPSARKSHPLCHDEPERLRLP